MAVSLKKYWSGKTNFVVFKQQNSSLKTKQTVIEARSFVLTFGIPGNDLDLVLGDEGEYHFFLLAVELNPQN